VRLKKLHARIKKLLVTGRVNALPNLDVFVILDSKEIVVKNLESTVDNQV